MSIAIWRTGIVSCLLAGCTVPAEHAALKAGKLPALVQAHRFAYQGDLPGGYQLSPDGRKLAWTGPFLMRSSLHVRDNQTGTVHRYRGRARDFQWSADSTRLLYASDRTGGENTHVYVINVADGSSDPVDLTPYPGVKASIHQITPSDPAHVLIRHNRRDRRLYDLYRVNLSTGQETMIAQNPGDAVMPVTARDGRFVSWQRPRESADESAQQKRRLTARQPILSKKPEETFRVLTVSADRSHVWALSSRGRDRIALVTAHPALGWEKVIFEDPEVDVTRVVMSRVSGMPLMASAQPGYPRDVILDPTLRDDLKALFD